MLPNKQKRVVLPTWFAEFQIVYYFYIFLDLREIRLIEKSQLPLSKQKKVMNLTTTDFQGLGNKLFDINKKPNAPRGSTKVLSPLQTRVPLE